MFSDPTSTRKRRRILRALFVPALLAAGALVAPRVRADVPAQAPASQASIPTGVERFTLPNGLEVAVAEDHRVPLVSIAVAYRVGDLDDGPHPGMAQLFAHLFADASTRHVPRDQRDAIWQSLGLEAPEVRSHAWLEGTLVHVEVPSDELELALWSESDRMGFFGDGVDEATVRSAANEVAANLRADAGEHGQVLDAAVTSALFGDRDPYASRRRAADSIGTVALADVRAHIGSYGPDRATLAVVGDVSPRAVRALVTKYFAPIAASSAPLARRTQPPASPLASARSVRIEAGLDDAEVVLAWPTVPEGDADDLALDVASRALLKRLTARLVAGEKSVAGLWVRENSAMAASYFTVWAEILPGHSEDAIVAAIDDEIARLRATPPSEAEVHDDVVPFVASHVLSAGSFRAWGGTLAIAGTARRDGKGAGLLGDGYRAITPAGVRRAVSAWLLPDRRVRISVVPTAGAPAAGRVVEGGSR